ncbi:amino acid ABC transporter permease [Herbaspirillum sp. LeCh32-8]|uniref:amino acid ABC transporter permease n=1 Tax=Herbaspirillum sp. LeCh32-8 TaxID=2821356 RepID=UPI001AE18A7A|nr:amino acid ABC transporter permease [Herbaspirillum sp. LeCh32-8]MBP0599214.1 amino acid ABC transporter permease [Herbaspirillum sp. LeCh32-8]
MDELRSLLTDASGMILVGTCYTVLYALLGMLFGLPVGMLVTLIRVERVPLLAPAMDIYVSFMRSTPQLIQAFLIYFGLGAAGIELPLVVIGTLVLTANAGAYLSETLRGAMSGVPRGQWAAGFSLGLTRMQTITCIIAPQALRLAIPGISNTLISLFKDTSVLSVITVAELMKYTGDIISVTFRPFTFYLVAACIYWLLCLAYQHGIHNRVEAHFGRAYRMAE